MTDPLQDALRALNEAAYAALRVALDKTTYPDATRAMLRDVAARTDILVETGGREG